MKDTKKKLTKAQQSCLDEIKESIVKAQSYDTFEEYFNSDVYDWLNMAWRHQAEKWQRERPEEWEEMNKKYHEKKDEQITLISAKTETIAVLEREGYIKVIEPATFKGCPELVKLLIPAKD